MVASWLDRSFSLIVAAMKTIYLRGPIHSCIVEYCCSTIILFSLFSHKGTSNSLFDQFNATHWSSIPVLAFKIYKWQKMILWGDLYIFNQPSYIIYTRYMRILILELHISWKMLPYIGLGCWKHWNFFRTKTTKTHVTNSLTQDCLDSCTFGKK